MNERLAGDPDRAWFETINDYGEFRHGCVLGAGPGHVEALLLARNPELRLTVCDISAGPLARLGQSESMQGWEAFLRQLERRGLVGRHLKLVITDGRAGLADALQTVYPYVPRRRCWAPHKLRNVSSLLKRSQQSECLAGARAIYLAATWREGVQPYWAWARRWRGEAPKAVACLERDLDELLNFLRCPEPHRRKIRTTNAIERCFREVRRRTRPISCFTNTASCERIIYAVVSHLNRSWEGKALPEITQE